MVWYWQSLVPIWAWPLCLIPTTAVNYVQGAEPLASAWAGRTLGLGLAMALAIALRSAIDYTVVFLGCVFRELGDIVGMFSTGETVTLAVLAVFLLLDLVGLFFSAKAIGKNVSSDPSE